MDTPIDNHVIPSDLIADLHASKAEIERGERVSMEPVLQNMQAAIDRIAKRRAAKST